MLADITEGSGLFTIVSLARAGSALFWRTDGTTGAGGFLRLGDLAPATVRGRDGAPGGVAGHGVLQDVVVNAVLANEGVSLPASMASAKQ